jgi:protein-tyrosine phosphatase
MDYNIRTVIDLRDETEVYEMPNAFMRSEVVKYMSIPLVGKDVRLSKVWLDTVLTMTDLASLYSVILDHCQPQVHRVLSTIAARYSAASGSGGGTLIHCVAGKDRTGIVTALLLGLAGVPEDTIIEDYALTREFLAEHIESRRANMVGEDNHLARFDLMYSSPPQTMAKTLAYLHEGYGGIVSYLRACGLSDEQMETLREYLVGD